MKSHKPIKRHVAIASFSKDHHFGLQLVWKIRQGLSKVVDAERISRYIQFFFNGNLEKHLKEEEELLFCRLPTGDVLRRQAEADHRAIYKLIATIEHNQDDIPVLIQLADTLEQHIRFEERELFNYLQDKISEEDLAAMSRRFSSDGNLLDEAWEDKFWL